MCNVLVFQAMVCARCPKTVVQVDLGWQAALMSLMSVFCFALYYVVVDPWQVDFERLNGCFFRLYGSCDVLNWLFPQLSEG